MNPDEYEIKIGKNGRRYLKVTGRPGWPMQMRPDEQPDDTLRRFDERKADRAADTAKAESRGNDRANEWLKSIPDPGERPPDPAPTSTAGAAKKHARKRKRPSTPELEAALAQVMVLPAIPARAVLHCDFCMMHFLTEGPKAAHELAVLAEEHDALRGLLERIHGAMETVTWGAVLAAYIGKPLAHHLMPAEQLATFGPVIGLPPREPPVHSHHEPAPTVPPDVAAAAAYTSPLPGDPPAAAGSERAAA
jgi:hypothetical protein